MRWSDLYTCSCGKTFRSYAAEAKHRHNFPLLCKRAKTGGQKSSEKEKKDEKGK